VSGPLISCVVPVFNGERYLKEALDSILVQTYRPLEIIVIDDGSTDGTAAVVTSYGAQVRYVSQPNAGPAAARNLGLREARGEFVAFLDADDLWYPEKLTRQMARFAARPELALCVTHIRNFLSSDVNSKIAAHYRDHPRLIRALPGYATGTLLARWTLFHTVGHFDSTLKHSDTTEWFLRAAERGAIIELVPDALVYRRLHETNFSHLEACASREEYLQLVKSYLDRRRLTDREAPGHLRTRTLPHAR
jgi:glycosyltransferase involved in cell wall biosynthesis